MNTMSTQVNDGASAIKRSTKEEPINNAHKQQGLQIDDTRDDQISDIDQDDKQYPPSRGCTDEAGVCDDNMSSDERKISELRKAILELRVYTCKLKGTNRHLQRQNDLVKEENKSLTNVICRLEEDRAKLKEENEQLRDDLGVGKVDTTISTLSSLDDDMFEFDEKPQVNDHVPLSVVTINSKLENVSAAQNSGDDAHDVEHKGEEATSSTPMKKARDTLYDINELQITTTNDGEEMENLRIELEHSREQCEELQGDLKKIANEYWMQREEFKKCQFRNDELTVENDGLKRLKWIEDEVDTLWAHVKEMDMANNETLGKLESVLAEKKELEEVIANQSSEIVELNARLQTGLPCPDWVHIRMDEIQNDLKKMRESRGVP